MHLTLSITAVCRANASLNVTYAVQAYSPDLFPTTKAFSQSNTHSLRNFEGMNESGEILYKSWKHMTYHIRSLGPVVSVLKISHDRCSNLSFVLFFTSTFLLSESSQLSNGN